MFGIRASFIDTIYLIDRLPWNLNIDASLGLLTLASLVKTDSRKVKIFPLWNQSHNCKPKFSVFENTDLFLEARPQLIGLSTICSTYPHTLKLSIKLRETYPYAWIILGGPAATATAVDTLAKIKAIDMIILGEAETSFPTLIKEIETDNDWSSVPGLLYRENGEIHVTAPAPLLKNLNLLPKLDYSLVGGLSTDEKVPIEAGRGCPYSCNFCSTSKFFGQVYRMKSSDRLIEEMDSINRQWGVTHFELTHDLFLFNKDFINEFCQLLQKKKNYYWDCSARFDLLDSEVIQKIAAAGCKNIFIGLESASDRIQKLIGKKLSLRHYHEIQEEIKRHGIKAIFSFILGFPDEMEKDVIVTLEAIINLIFNAPSFNFSLNLLIPLPGSEITEEHRNRLCFDGFSTSFGQTGDNELEQFIKGNLEIMPQFQFLANDRIERRFYRNCYNFFLHVPYFTNTLYEWMDALGSPHSLAKFLFKWLNNSRLFKYNLFVNSSDNLACLSDFGNECLQASDELGVKIQSTFLHEFLMSSIAMIPTELSPWAYIDLGNFNPRFIVQNELCVGLQKRKTRYFAYYSKTSKMGFFLSNIQIMPTSVEALGNPRIIKIVKRIIESIKRR